MFLINDKVLSNFEIAIYFFVEDLLLVLKYMGRKCLIWFLQVNYMVLGIQNIAHTKTYSIVDENSPLIKVDIFYYRVI